ncbi:MAG: hypothetical protein R3D25_10780 [Geminicoccaceae bacterium]
MSGRLACAGAGASAAGRRLPPAEVRASSARVGACRERPAAAGGGAGSISSGTLARGRARAGRRGGTGSPAGSSTKGSPAAPPNRRSPIRANMCARPPGRGSTGAVSGMTGSGMTGSGIPAKAGSPASSAVACRRRRLRRLSSIARLE